MKRKSSRVYDNELTLTCECKGALEVCPKELLFPDREVCLPSHPKSIFIRNHTNNVVEILEYSLTGNYEIVGNAAKVIPVGSAAFISFRSLREDLGISIGTLTIRYVNRDIPDTVVTLKSKNVRCTSNTTSWLDRFTWTYNKLKDISNGYFGPKTGPNAYMVPYHAVEKTIIIEAPDWTHESVSETASFWVKLEAWKFVVSGENEGMVKVWDSLEKVWIPDSASQPWGNYDFDRPAEYMPDVLNLSDSPANLDFSFNAGKDPLGENLLDTYGTLDVYLMHWLIDVDGDYGFRNPDNTKVNVYINNFRRGPTEDGLATITHPALEDFNNGGGEYGFGVIYNRDKPIYPDSSSDDGYSKSVMYTMAGDADVRAVGSVGLAIKESLAGSALPSEIVDKTSKMSDYLRYTLYDKYFKPIPGYDAAGCHYLVSWGFGWGVGLPIDDNQSYWGFRIGNSEVHHGYNGIDAAYAARTGGVLDPQAPNSKNMWAISLDRQLELVRWLQSPEGPIAGGVTSNWKGNYLTPTDGREAATFYGMYYNYSPSWYNPPSNNWIGFQSWGLQRVSEVFLLAAQKSNDYFIARRCEVILDNWVKWFYQECSLNLGTGDISYPINLKWVSNTLIPGVTASQPAAKYLGIPENPPIEGLADVYEYLPTLKWPGSNPNYAAFWDGNVNTVNPNLHCSVAEYGWDFGTGSGIAQILIQYCAAKKIMSGGVLTGNLPGTGIPLENVLLMGAKMMEILWRKRDSIGFGTVEPMSVSRLDDILWIPPEFGVGHMPNGELMENGKTTFGSLRESFYNTTKEYPAIRKWLDEGKVGEPPKTMYHRFWQNVDMAVGFAMLSKYFPETYDEVNNVG